MEHKVDEYVSMNMNSEQVHNQTNSAVIFSNNSIN